MGASCPSPAASGSPKCCLSHLTPSNWALLSTLVGLTCRTKPLFCYPRNPLIQGYHEDVALPDGREAGYLAAQQIPGFQGHFPPPPAPVPNEDWHWEHPQGAAALPKPRRRPFSPSSLGPSLRSRSGSQRQLSSVVVPAGRPERRPSAEAHGPHLRETRKSPMRAPTWLSKRRCSPPRIWGRAGR